MKGKVKFLLNVKVKVFLLWIQATTEGKIITSVNSNNDSHHDPRAGLSPWRNVVDSSGRLGSPLPAIVHWELSEIRHYNEDGYSLLLEDKSILHSF